MDPFIPNKSVHYEMGYMGYEWMGNTIGKYWEYS